MLKIKRRYLFILWCWAWFLGIILLLFPISYGIFRLAIVIIIFWLWLGAMFLFWDRKLIRLGCFSIAFIVSAIAIFPGYNPDGNRLRDAYVQALNYYEGSPYLWGGESKIGIDCSGLVRQGLIKANFQQGFLTFNPKLIRQGFSLWWYDASAQALGEEYKDFTKFLYDAASINELDYTKIKKGDIAVSKDGIYTLAYIGNNIWIEADPNYQKVIKVKAPEPNNIWFRVPVKILEWRQFQTP